MGIKRLGIQAKKRRKKKRYKVELKLLKKKYDDDVLRLHIKALKKRYGFLRQ